MSFARSERVNRLRQELLSTPEVLCVQRARIVTESYRSTEGEPMILRRAKALRDILAQMDVFLRNDELIVGQQTEKVRGVPVFPETGALWIDSELDIFDKRRFKQVRVDEEDRVLLRDLLGYWKHQTVHHRLMQDIPDETRNVLLFENSPLSPNLFIRNAIGHLLVDYPKVLRLGFDGIKAEAREWSQALDLTQPGSHERRHFYEAVCIVCDAASHFGQRYSAEATRLAETEQDPDRRREFEAIADCCARVPRLPARNFREALQSFWFVQLIIQIDTDGLAISPGRFDQYMFPYLENDWRDGVLDRPAAQELLNCLWIKFYEIIKLVDNPNLDDMAFGTGNNLSQNLVVGGVDANGRDATNELSYMCLEAEGTVHLDQPSFSIRVHADSPTLFLEKTIDVVRLGGGKPALFFDQASIPSLLATGVPLPEARNYALCGCVEPAPVYNSYTWANGGMFNLPKCVELALNDGICLLTGERIGPATGSPGSFQDFEEVWAAFITQVRYFVGQLVITLNACDRLHGEQLPTPFVSALTDDCLAHGLDVSRGGAHYNHIGISGIGLADAADSLAAVRALVFETKAVTLPELVRAMRDNFVGYADLYHQVRSRAPKYGNDDDRADLLARDIGLLFCTEASRHVCHRGGTYRPGLFPVASNVPLGRKVAALPSGRLSRTPLADGISPAPGCDSQGPTAVIKSVTKVDHVAVPNGTLLNIKFHPDSLRDTKGVRSLISLIRAMGARQGMHMQFNVVSADTLRQAQQEPDQYRDLLIRVAGYSAFFVELDRNLQDHIISRSEHSLGE